MINDKIWRKKTMISPRWIFKSKTNDAAHIQWKSNNNKQQQPHTTITNYNNWSSLREYLWLHLVSHHFHSSSFIRSLYSWVLMTAERQTMGGNNNGKIWYCATHIFTGDNSQSLYICSSRRQQQNIQIVHIIELLRQPGRYCIQFSAAHLLPSTIYRRVNFECEISFEWAVRQSSLFRVCVCVCARHKYCNAIDPKCKI